MSRRDIYLKDDYFSYKTIPASKIFKKFFRRIDFYAKPITLRHKGEYKFYTNLGMYTSLIIIIIISLFSTYLFINMIFGSNFTVDSTIIYHTPNNYPVINLQDRQFPIGFALLDEDGNIFKDAKYFKFKMFTKLIDKNNPQLSAENEFDLTSCSNTGILGERYADYFCPVSLNHSVEGTNLNEQHTMLGFKVDQCPESGDITCEPENVIIDKLKTLRMKVVYDKATFDFGSKNNPIGRITDDSTEIGLSSMCTGTRIFLRDNVHRAARNPLLFWLEDTTKFIQIKDHHNFVEGCNRLNHLGQVQFVISDEYDQFQRSLFSLVDFLVQVGGSFNSLKAIGFLITAVFSYRMFYASLIRALFFFDTTPEEFKKQFKKAEKKARKNKNKSGSNHEAANYLSNNNNQVVAKSKFEDYTDMEKIKLCALNDSSASEYSENNDPEAGEGDDFSLDKRLGYDKIRGKMLDKLGYKTLKYDYKCKSIFKSLVFCQICRTRNYLKKNRETRKLMLYYKGMEKLDQEIDIVEIVRKFRKLDVLVKLLLKKDQQLILDLKNAIYISSEEESERYLLGYTKKKVLRKHKLLQKYIDNIKSKELTSQDEKLLNILGFKDVCAMLARPAQLAKVNSNWTDRRHPVFGLSGSPKKQRRSSQKGSDSQGKGTGKI
ncbi:unnamed protein product [Moneuplotes crassus]|uniref:Uncharacterized protein n=1 Tax=Euplotes crassus TaxID=5936 RepID=A0AAD1XWR1_EUPCR|nr:unnamed protein product [Moneuplotes crassus]